MKRVHGGAGLILVPHRVAGAGEPRRLSVVATDQVQADEDDDGDADDGDFDGDAPGPTCPPDCGR